MLKTITSNEDKMRIGQALESLFRCQGRKPDAETLKDLINGICGSATATLTQTLMGIESLKTATLKVISLPVILDAIKAQIEPDPVELSNARCLLCDDSGAIPMQEVDGVYTYVLACCKCQKGIEFQNRNGGRFWNGELRQKRGDKWLEMVCKWRLR